MQYVETYAVDAGAPVSYEFVMAMEVLMRENNLQMRLSAEE